MHPPAVLHLDNLTKRFGSLVAVDGLSLDIYQGEILGFLGPNGAGKTTTIQMVCGLLKPDHGRVYLDGRLLHPGDREIANKIGVCPQSVITWGSLTCLEQLEFIGEMYGLPRSVSRQRGEWLLETIGLEEKRHHLGKHLSGGMLRRLNLILALVHDPEILILDEPEAGLDPQSRILVREYIRSLAPQKTIILTSHNMDEVERLAVRVAIIDHGRLLKLDTPENLKNEVGTGDVLEVELLPEQAEKVLHLIPLLCELVSDAAVTGQTLVIRRKGIVASLSNILDFLKTHEIHPVEMRLRSSTLEDVFISLTGRRLRE